MIFSLNAPSGATISLDLEGLFGERVELEAFQFISPPIEFRLVRGDKPLQEWQKGNSEIYDLQRRFGQRKDEAFPSFSSEGASTRRLPRKLNW
jgi:hypothetical protein